jgi:hypothetical protein
MTVLLKQLLLTIDDLRAMRRSVGIWLPGFAESGDGVGLRGELELDEVIRLAEAFTDAVVAVEVLSDRAGIVTEYAYSVSASGARGLMESLPRGLVRCTLPEEDPVSVVASVAGLSRELMPAEGLMWTVSAGAYQRCDSLALAGDEEGAVAALTRAEITEPTAKAWVAALCGRGSAAALTVVRRDPDSGRWEAGELRFVADQQGGAWRITSDEAGYTITPVSGDSLLAALEELMREGRS